MLITLALNCLTMSHNSAYVSQSCCFCDVHKLYLTTLYILTSTALETAFSDGHAEAKPGEEMFHYHTHAPTMLVPVSGQHPKYANTWKYTQKSNLSALLAIQQLAHAQKEVCWFTRRNTGCSVSLKISIVLSSHVAKTGPTHKASIAQKLPGRNGSFMHILQHFLGAIRRYIQVGLVARGVKM